MNWVSAVIWDPWRKPLRYIKPFQKHVLLTLVMPLCAGVQPAAGSYERHGAQPTAQFPPGLCVNVSDRGLLATPRSASIIASLKAEGVKVIRVPLLAEGHISPTPPYTVDRDYLSDVLSTAQNASAQGLSVILDAHDFRSLKASPADGEAKFVAFWAQASNAWKELPTTVMYELLNEPNGKIGPSNFKSIISGALLSVRKNDENRKVVIGGFWSSHYKSLSRAEFPYDKNVIVTIHYYDPMNFTHQGAAWKRDYADIRLSVSDSSALQKMNLAVITTRKFIDRTGHIPFVGEYGVTTFASSADRTKYISMVATAFAAIGVNSCLWAWGDRAFSIDSNGRFRPEIKQALKPLRINDAK